MRTVRAQVDVPLVDLAAAHREVADELDAAFRRVVADGAFVLGPEVAALEREFADYCGVPECVGVSNGTDALALLLSALGIGPGDEVITSTFTFVATVEAILRTGARPVLCDVAPDDQNLSPSGVKEVLTERTRAVVAVHLYGRVADMAAFEELTTGSGVALVEDAAQAHGARDARDARGARAGALGQGASFSFYPGKNLGALGDAGAVTTADAELADTLARLRDHGRTGKYVHGDIGYNARLDGLQAAFLRVKLPLLDDWNERRRQAAARYRELLDGIEDLAVPCAEPGEVFHVYGVRTDRRDEVADALAAAGIASGVHYPVPVHRQPAFEHLFAGQAFPNADRWAATELSLPMHPHLTPDVQERVAAAVRATLDA